MKKPTLLYFSGLVEVVETGWSFYIVKGEEIGYKFTTQVQFIHQSANDYLNSTKTQKELADMLGPTPLQSSLYWLLSWLSIGAELCGPSGDVAQMPRRRLR